VLDCAVGCGNKHFRINLIQEHYISFPNKIYSRFSAK
jgi:hypothetical protein